MSSSAFLRLVIFLASSAKHITLWTVGHTLWFAAEEESKKIEFFRALLSAMESLSHGQTITIGKNFLQFFFAPQTSSRVLETSCVYAVESYSSVALSNPALTSAPPPCLLLPFFSSARARLGHENVLIQRCVAKEAAAILLLLLLLLVFPVFPAAAE